MCLDIVVSDYMTGSTSTDSIPFLHSNFSTYFFCPVCYFCADVDQTTLTVQ